MKTSDLLRLPIIKLIYKSIPQNVVSNSWFVPVNVGHDFGARSDLDFMFISRLIKGKNYRTVRSDNRTVM